MTTQIFYLYGFSLLLLSNVYAVYWNESEFLNADGRGSRRIRHKLVTFDTTETDVEVAFQFNVPFVAVPTDRSAGNTKNAIRSLVNLNLGSIALAGVMIAFGTLTSYIWTLLVPKPSTMTNTNDDSNTTVTPDPDSTNDIDGITPTPTAGQSPKSEKAYERNKFFDLMDLLDATVNPVVCVQQYICSLRKITAKNVAEGCAESSDKIIDGIFEARWVLDIISGTAVHDAIRFGESRSDCEKRFSKCGFDSMRSEDVFTIFLKVLRVFGTK